MPETSDGGWRLDDTDDAEGPYGKGKDVELPEPKKKDSGWKKPRTVRNSAGESRVVRD